MPIQDISRNSNTINISAAYTLKDPNIGQVIANCTSAGFTLTIYDDLDSGAYHRLVVKISDSDSSGNTLTIVNAGATFSTTLASTSAAVELETDNEGNWLAVASFPTLDANTAISAADSAGLRASDAQSGADSTALTASTTASTNKSTAASATLSGVSAAESIAASATLSGVSGTASTATSQNVSQSQNISTTGSIAASATLSGVSATASVATSQNASQSLNVSSALSLASS